MDDEIPLAQVGGEVRDDEPLRAAPSLPAKEERTRPNATMVAVVVLATIAIITGLASFILSALTRQQVNAIPPFPALTNYSNITLNGDVLGLPGANKLRNLSNAIPGIFPPNGTCTTQTMYSSDGRAIVINPCLPVQLVPTGWPAGLACPNSSYVVTNIGTTTDNRVSLVECTLTVATELNETSACGPDLMGLYPCAQLTHLIPNSGCFNFTV